ncbi:MULTISPECIES: hypothetical protein [unclassified Chamaesiphon]|nr:MULTISPECIES: hypothetical protein [unclassified Chamaesiphon]
MNDFKVLRFATVLIEIQSHAVLLASTNCTDELPQKLTLGEFAAENV